MALTLVTGPANSAKAGVLLDRFRSLADRDPVLVVPTWGDVQHYGRELAAGGMVFGGEVTRFAPLLGGLARTLGVAGRPIGALTRDRVAAAAVADARLELLSRSAASPGFAVAARDLFTELQRERVTPQRFTGALRAWGAEVGREAYAEELARLYAAYRRRLERLSLADAAGFTWRVLDALRERPQAWGDRPLFLYGFDDLQTPQRDLVETLARRTAAEVWVALPYEPGRAALVGCAETVHELEPLAARHERLTALDEHYAHPALHHLERSLFESDVVPSDAGGGVRLLEAGGERAEAELAGAEVLALLHQGVAAADIAIALRGDDAPAVFAQVLESYGVPVTRDRSLELRETRLGLGVLALLRAALPGGTAADVLTWLRTPGKLRSAPLLDGLERRMRRDEAATPADARRAWEAEWDPFKVLGELQAALKAGPRAALEVLVREAESVWTGPRRREAAVMEGAADEDARVAGALRKAAQELAAIAERDGALLRDPADLLEALAGVSVRPPASQDGVVIAGPMDLRARRFRVLFACGLQEGDMPRRPDPDPFLDDDDRRALARASGLVLPTRGDGLARERTLFYELCSRPQELLYLSFRSATEDGGAMAVSPFVTDVRELFTEELWTQRGRRLLADVTWSTRDAPTPHELARARALEANGSEPAALAPPADPGILAALAARGSEPARAVEAFAQCGVRWLVETLLRPQRVDPDPEPMRRGSLAHSVLERTLSGLKERTGSARLVPETLGGALAELDTAIRELAGTPGGASARAGLRALEADLRRYLRHECLNGSGFEPEHLEWDFEELEIAEGVTIHGRVDRVDVARDGRALVRDYKGRTVHSGKSWASGQRLQVALYALAVRAQLGLTPAGALYQPLGGTDLRPRGFVEEEVPGRYVSTDVVDEGALRAQLGNARAEAASAVTRLRAGDIRPCPQTCSPNGCAYPTICRAGVAPAEEADAA
jgi:ATP-dependent helicase/DNAse subunit B